MARVRIGAAVGGSFGFLATAWRHAWGILLAWVWLAGASQAIQSLRPEWFFIPLLGFPVTIAVSTAAIGALYRIGIEPGHPGDARFRAHPAGLWWGALEWRVLGANILLGLILGLLTAALIFVWFMALGIVSVSLAGQGLQGADASVIIRFALVSAVILIPGLLGLFYLGARWLIYPLYAADTGSFDLGAAWGMTRGASLAIVLALVVIFLAQSGLVVLSFIVAAGVAGVVGHDAAAPAAWGLIATQLVGTAISAPLGVGLQQSVYRALRPDGGVDVAATFA